MGPPDVVERTIAHEKGPSLRTGLFWERGPPARILSHERAGGPRSTEGLGGNPGEVPDALLHRADGVVRDLAGEGAEVLGLRDAGLQAAAPVLGADVEGLDRGLGRQGVGPRGEAGVGLRTRMWANSRRRSLAALVVSVACSITLSSGVLAVMGQVLDWVVLG